MIIEKMTYEHLHRVLEIEQDSFTHPWNEEAFLSEIKKENSHCYVALQNNEVIGYAVMTTVLDEGDLLLISVEKSHRRKGVANALFSKFCDIAKENKLSFITLEVRASNLGAKALYEKLGFEYVSVRKNYYSNPVEDAVLMTKYFEF